MKCLWAFLREKDKIPKKRETSLLQEKQHERTGWLESAAFLPVRILKCACFPLSHKVTMDYLEFSNSYMDFSFFCKLSLDWQKYASVPINANSLKRVLTYNELQLRCGVNVIIPTRNIDGSMLGAGLSQHSGLKPQVKAHTWACWQLS